MPERRITRDELAAALPIVRVPMRYVGSTTQGAGWFDRDTAAYADRLIEAAVAARHARRTPRKDAW